MALHLDPQGDPDPNREPGKLRSADIGEHRQVVRDGVQQLAHGALVCSDCKAPMAIERSLLAGERIACGFCGKRARAREFIVEDVYDTVANEVYLVARLR